MSDVRADAFASSLYDSVCGGRVRIFRVANRKTTLLLISSLLVAIPSGQMHFSQLTKRARGEREIMRRIMLVCSFVDRITRTHV